MTTRKLAAIAATGLLGVGAAIAVAEASTPGPIACGEWSCWRRAPALLIPLETPLPHEVTTGWIARYGGHVAPNSREGLTLIYRLPRSADLGAVADEIRKEPRVLGVATHEVRVECRSFLRPSSLNAVASRVACLTRSE